MAAVGGKRNYMSRLEISYYLLLKIIETQKASNPLDAAKTSEEWPAAAGAAVTPRGISDRLIKMKKDAIERGLVGASFSLPCSNYLKKKGGEGGRGKGNGGRRGKKRSRDDFEAADSDDEEGGEADGAINKDGKKSTCVNTKSQYSSPPPTNEKKTRTTGPPVTTTKAARHHGPTSPATERDEAVQGESGDGSESDSLADLKETPSQTAQAPRILPARRSRTVRNYYNQDDNESEDNNDDDEEDDMRIKDTPPAPDADEFDSEDEFDPFKLRAEQNKRNEVMMKTSQRWQRCTAAGISDVD